MQKKLIALAVAGMVAAPVFAQSNVTVYGIVDTFVGYGKAGDAKFSGLESGALSGSRLGFKGSEDLGNGLKAKFALEQGFASDTGNENDAGKAFHRQAWVGLEGGFGFIGLGRQYAPGYYTYRNDALSAGQFDPRWNVASDLNIVSASAQRWDNSISYQTPNWSGFSAQVIYAFGSRETETDVAGAIDKDDDDQFAIGLNYANGPLNVDYVYVNTGDEAVPAIPGTPIVVAGQVVTPVGTPAQPNTDTDEHYLGGAYDFGMFTLVGSYQVSSIDDGIKNLKQQLTFGDYDVKVWQIGGIVPVGMGNIHVAYAARNDDRDQADSTSYGIMYTHDLSKRTTAYAALNRTTNDDDVGRGALARANGESSNAIGLGIRHAF